MKQLLRKCWDDARRGPPAWAGENSSPGRGHLRTAVISMQTTMGLMTRILRQGLYMSLYVHTQGPQKMPSFQASKTVGRPLTKILILLIPQARTSAAKLAEDMVSTKKDRNRTQTGLDRLGSGKMKLNRDKD